MLNLKGYTITFNLNCHGVFSPDMAKVGVGEGDKEAAETKREGVIKGGGALGVFAGGLKIIIIKHTSGHTHYLRKQTNLVLVISDAST